MSVCIYFTYFKLFLQCSEACTFIILMKLWASKGVLQQLPRSTSDGGIINPILHMRKPWRQRHLAKWQLVTHDEKSYHHIPNPGPSLLVTLLWHEISGAHSKQNPHSVFPATDSMPRIPPSSWAQNSKRGDSWLFLCWAKSSAGSTWKRIF